jgi:hypothetical protein
VTISFPLSLPAGIVFSDAVMRQMSVVGLSVSPYTGAQEAVAYPGQWWEIDFTTTALVEAQAAKLEAFFASLNGQEGTFLCGDPWRATPRGTAASSPGTPTVDGAVSARAASLPIKGGPVLQSGWVLAGDYIQINTGSSSLLVMALEDANTDSAGDASVTVWPRMRRALVDGEAINFSSPRGVFRLSQNQNDVPRRAGSFAPVSFSAREAF